MKNIFKYTFLTLMLTAFIGCETGDLDLLNDPNNLTEESADPNFILNDVQITFRNIFSGYNGPSQTITRMTNQFGAYSGPVNDGTLSFEWSQSYQMFTNIDNLQAIHESSEDGIANLLGVAQIFEAFSYILLVDYLGDVPYDEANQPEEFPNPKVTLGATVYAKQLELLDEAISNLQSGSTINPSTDLYFGEFDKDKWIAVANTLKLRVYNNLRLTQPAQATEGINQVLNAGFINTEAGDFQFNYSTVDNPVDSRHPFFTNGYLASGAGTYMSNNYLDLLNAGDGEAPFIETGTPDPRVRYYLYRQSSSEPSGSNLPCAGDATYDYCYVGNLYWGRGHGDDAGIPNDNTKRTTFGVYPGGGSFDRDLFEQARGVSESLEGAGILPILTSSFSNFILAEASVSLNINAGSTVSLLEKGIRASMAKATGFVGSLSTINPDTSEDFGATNAQINSYVNDVISEFNGASNDSERLAIVAREHYLSTWGNGVEGYNLYKRTGFPVLQSSIRPTGPFPRSFRYPDVETENNPNISQQEVTSRVFWDNNPAGFVD